MNSEEIRSREGKEAIEHGSIRINGSRALQITVSWVKFAVIIVTVLVGGVGLWIALEGRFDGISDAIVSLGERVSRIEGILESLLNRSAD